MSEITLIAGCRWRPWVGCGCWGQVGLQVGGSHSGKGRSRVRADSRQEKLENQDWVKPVSGELRDKGVPLLFYEQGWRR